MRVLKDQLQSMSKPVAGSAHAIIDSCKRLARMQILVHLFSAQLQLAVGQQAPADESLDKALKLLAVSRKGPLAKQAANLQLQHLEVHAHVLQLLSALAAGKTASLQQTSGQAGAWPFTLSSELSKLRCCQRLGLYGAKSDIVDKFSDALGA